MLLGRKPSEPERCLEIFNEAKRKYHAKPRIEDYYFYSVALDKIGDKQAADRLLDKLEQFDTLSVASKNWRYILYKNRRDYHKALSLFEKTIIDQDSLIISMLRQSLERSQRKYYETKAQVEEAKKDAATDRFWLLIILAGIAISLIVGVWIRARQRLLEKLEKISMLKEEVDMQLALLKESEVKETDYRKKYLSIYKNQYQLLNNLCASYLSPSRGNPKDKVFREVENVLMEISNDNGKPSLAEKYVNNAWDDLMNRVRVDYPSFSEKDYKLIALFVMGFEAKTISLLMNYTPKTVYGKKARIKRRIADSSVAAKQEYLAFLSEK